MNNRDGDELDLAKALKARRAALAAKKVMKAHPEISSVLKFLEQDLARLIDHLGAFAEAPTSRESDLASAAVLGGRLLRLGRILNQQTAESWSDAATSIGGHRGWKAWRVTCEGIARSPQSVNDARLAGDHLAQAGELLEQFREAETSATLALLARDAARSLIQAAALWNATQRWRDPVDKPKP